MTPLSGMALLLGVGRIAIGLPVTVRPRIASVWIGNDATGSGAQALSRGLAGRDVALGAGLVAAVARDECVRLWLTAGAMADAVDFVGTALAGDALPKRARAATMALAASAAMLGAGLAAIWDRRAR